MIRFPGTNLSRKILPAEESPFFEKAITVTVLTHSIKSEKICLLLYRKERNL